MRLFELLILIALLSNVLISFIPGSKRPGFAAKLPLLAPVLIVLHLVIEGHRWQMMPAYILSVILLLIGLPALMGKKTDKPLTTGKRVLNIFGSLLGLAFVVVAAAPPHLFPVFEIPPTTGPYTVGVVTMELTDSSRSEPFESAAGSQRRLLLHIWYPAADDEGKAPLRYVASRNQGSMLSEAVGLPPFLFSHFYHTKTNSYPEVAPAAVEGGFPVVLYSSAPSPGFYTQNTVPCETLASNGFVVISIGRPYEMAQIPFKDGVVKPDPVWYQSMREESQATVELFKEYRFAEDPMERESMLRQYYDMTPTQAEMLARWTDDTLFVIENLYRIQSGDLPGPLAGTLDTDRLGIFGMDFGGSVAGQVCAIAPNVLAGLNYGGVQTGDLIDMQAGQPFMAIYGADSEGFNDLVYERAFPKLYRLTITGAKATDLTDFTIVSPFFHRIEFLGTIEGARMTQILSNYTLAFFDRHVKGVTNDALLDGPSTDYPEAQLEVIERATEAPQEEESGEE